MDAETMSLEEETNQIKLKLEKNIELEIIECNRLKEIQIERKRKDRLLYEWILNTISMIQEANVFSIEMLQDMSFSIKLVPQNANTAKKDAEEPILTKKSNESMVQFKYNLDSHVWISCHLSTGSYVLWDYEEFSHRLYNMREMYHRYVRLKAVDSSARLEDIMEETEDNPFEV